MRRPAARSSEGMLEPGGELDLALEALDADTGGHLRRQHLDDDLAAQAGLLGEEDPAHPAAAQLLLDAVGIAERRLEAGLEVLDVGLRGMTGGLKYREESRDRLPNGRAHGSFRTPPQLEVTRVTSSSPSPTPQAVRRGRRRGKGLDRS